MEKGEDWVNEWERERERKEKGGCVSSKNIKAIKSLWFVGRNRSLRNTRTMFCVQIASSIQHGADTSLGNYTRSIQRKLSFDRFSIERGLSSILLLLLLLLPLLYNNDDDDTINYDCSRRMHPATAHITRSSCLPPGVVVVAFLWSFAFSFSFLLHLLLSLSFSLGRSEGKLM